jgi:hypothetical protein
MKILAVSDVVLSLLYNAHVVQRFPDVDVLIGCGDLPYYYLEYLISTLNRPLYYVRGNHASRVEYGVSGEQVAPLGGVDLHRRCVRTESGLLLAGVEGSLVYNYGPYQYSQVAMWWYVLGLVPALLWNKLRRGRFLDVFVTHAPPWRIHDQDDLPHQGIKAFQWFDRVFQPAYHLHGHIHVYQSDTITLTHLGRTQIVNTFGYRELQLD